MPTFNSRRYLEQALVSVQTQLRPGDELVVQDGGSTDGSVEILRRFSDDDTRISFVSERDGGQSEALGRALERATGDYIGWVNADDYLEAGALDEVRRLLDASEASPTVVYGAYNIVDASGSLLRTLRPQVLAATALYERGCYVFSGSCFIRSRDLRAVGFAQDFHFAMDYKMFLDLAVRPGFACQNTDCVLGTFRYHSTSKTGGQAYKFISDAYRVRKIYRRTLGFSRLATLRYMIWTSLAVLSARVRYTRIYGFMRGQDHVT